MPRTTDLAPKAQAMGATATQEAPAPMDIAALELETTGAVAAPEGPALDPPGTPGTAAAQAITGMVTDRRLSLLYVTNHARNCWVHVTGIGWKKLAAGNDDAMRSLVQLATVARDHNRRVDYREEADGIHEIYVW